MKKIEKKSQGIQISEFEGISSHSVCKYAQFIESYINLDTIIWDIKVDILNHLQSCESCNKLFMNLLNNSITDENNSNDNFQKKVYIRIEPKRSSTNGKKKTVKVYDNKLPYAGKHKPYDVTNLTKITPFESKIKKSIALSTAMSMKANVEKDVEKDTVKHFVKWINKFFKKTWFHLLDRVRFCFFIY